LENIGAEQSAPIYFQIEPLLRRQRRKGKAPAATIAPGLGADVAFSQTLGWGTDILRIASVRRRAKIPELPRRPPGNPKQKSHESPSSHVSLTLALASQRAGPGSIFFHGSNDEHGMKNVGTSIARYHGFRIIAEAAPPAPTKA
jgi:hypothetical protein